MQSLVHVVSSCRVSAMPRSTKTFQRLIAAIAAKCLEMAHGPFGALSCPR